MKMILVHLASNKKSAIIDVENILFAESMEGKDEKNKKVNFTKIYLKTPLPGEEESKTIDIKETPENIFSMMELIKERG